MLATSSIRLRPLTAMKLMEAQRNSQLLAGSMGCHAASYLSRSSNRKSN